MSERFWEVMCAGIPVWGILFGLCVVFLVFSLMTLYLATPEAGAYHILVINVALILPLMGALGYTIRKCRSGDF
jgi:hypothetical protein